VFEVWNGNLNAPMRLTLSGLCALMLRLKLALITSDCLKLAMIRSVSHKPDADKTSPVVPKLGGAHQSCARNIDSGKRETLSLCTSESCD
jgi:hypothetical protein